MRGELVAVTPNGALCVLIPLYTKVKGEPIDSVGGYSVHVFAEPETPTGYLMDWEDAGTEAKFFNEKILQMVEVLGDL